MSANTYSSDVNDVFADVRSLRLAVAKGSPLELRTVCGGLASDAGTLYGVLPTPSHNLTDELGAAMSDFFNGAEKCAVASSTRSTAVRRAEGSVSAGMTLMTTVHATLARLGIRSPSPGGHK